MHTSVTAVVELYRLESPSRKQVEIFNELLDDMSNVVTEMKYPYGQLRWLRRMAERAYYDFKFNVIA